MADRLCWAPHFFESGSAFWPCVLVPDSEVPPNLHQDVRQPDARLVRFLGGGPGKPIYNWCNEQDLLMWAQNFQLLQVARGVPQQLLPMFSLGMQEAEQLEQQLYQQQQMQQQQLLYKQQSQQQQLQQLHTQQLMQHQQQQQEQMLLQQGLEQVQPQLHSQLQQQRQVYQINSPQSLHVQTIPMRQPQQHMSQTALQHLASLARGQQVQHLTPQVQHMQHTPQQQQLMSELQQRQPQQHQQQHVRQISLCSSQCSSCAQPLTQHEASRGSICGACTLDLQHGRICKVCSRASGASGVQCGACTSWLHSGCDEFAAAVAAASPEDDVEYFCPSCRAALLQQQQQQVPEHEIVQSLLQAARAQPPQKKVLLAPRLEQPSSSSDLQLPPSSTPPPLQPIAANAPEYQQSRLALVQFEQQLRVMRESLVQPRSAFTIFTADMLKTYETDGHSVSATDMATVSATAWRQLSTQEQTSYETKSAKEVESYKTEVLQYQAIHAHCATLAASLACTLESTLDPPVLPLPPAQRRTPKNAGAVNSASRARIAARDMGVQPGPLKSRGPFKRPYNDDDDFEYGYEAGQQAVKKERRGSDGGEGLAGSDVLEADVPSRVPVSCNGIRGTFLLETIKILCECSLCCKLEEEELPERHFYHPTQWEGHCGNAAAKKWKASIKVIPGYLPEVPAGASLMTIGRWLEIKGLEIKGSRTSGGLPTLEYAGKKVGGAIDTKILMRGMGPPRPVNKSNRPLKGTADRYPGPGGGSGTDEMREQKNVIAYEPWRDVSLGNYQPIKVRWAGDRCCVCDSEVDYDFDQLVNCDCCGITVHQSCYGIPDLPGLDDQWMCRSCELKEAGKPDPQCCLCPVVGGALKPTTLDGLWCHAACMQWIPEVTVNDTMRMEPIDRITEIQKERWELTCCFCKQKMGANIQCKNCFTAFHPLCARMGGLRMELLEPADGSGGTLQLEAYCPRHCKPLPALAGIQPVKEEADYRGVEGASNGLSNAQPFKQPPALPIQPCKEGCARAHHIDPEGRVSHGPSHGLGFTSNKGFWIPELSDMNKKSIRPDSIAKPEAIAGDSQAIIAPARPKGGKIKGRKSTGSTTSKALLPSGPPPFAELLALPDDTPNEVLVTCNGRHATLLLRTQIIVYDGSHMAPSRFEGICGKGDAKKWKGSLWFETEDGSPVCMMQDYLNVRSLDRARLAKYAANAAAVDAYQEWQQAFGEPDHGEEMALDEEGPDKEGDKAGSGNESEGDKPLEGMVEETAQGEEGPASAATQAADGPERARQAGAASASAVETDGEAAAAGSPTQADTNTPTPQGADRNAAATANTPQAGDTDKDQGPATSAAQADVTAAANTPQAGDAVAAPGSSTPAQAAKQAKEPTLPCILRLNPMELAGVHRAMAPNVNLEDFTGFGESSNPADEGFECLPSNSSWEQPEACVGHCCRVYWPEDFAWYAADVIAYDAAHADSEGKPRHRLWYHLDEEGEWIDLAEEEKEGRVRWLPLVDASLWPPPPQVLPSAPASTAPTAAAPSAGIGAGAAQAAAGGEPGALTEFGVLGVSLARVGAAVLGDGNTREAGVSMGAVSAPMQVDGAVPSATTLTHSATTLPHSATAFPHSATTLPAAAPAAPSSHVPTTSTPPDANGGCLMDVNGNRATMAGARAPATTQASIPQQVSGPMDADGNRTIVTEARALATTQASIPQQAPAQEAGQRGAAGAKPNAGDPAPGGGPPEAAPDAAMAEAMLAEHTPVPAAPTALAAALAEAEAAAPASVPADADAEADPATEFQEAAPAPPVKENPGRLDIVCNGLEAVMDTNALEVIMDGRRMTPTELERLAGKGSSKKWKVSLRVRKADGSPGMTLLDWLVDYGLEAPRSHRNPGATSPQQLDFMRRRQNASLFRQRDSGSYRALANGGGVAVGSVGVSGGGGGGGGGGSYGRSEGNGGTKSHRPGCLCIVCKQGRRSDRGGGGGSSTIVASSGGGSRGTAVSKQRFPRVRYGKRAYVSAVPQLVRGLSRHPFWSIPVSRTCSALEWAQTQGCSVEDLNKPASENPPEDGEEEGAAAATECDGAEARVVGTSGLSLGAPVEASGSGAAPAGKEEGTEAVAVKEGGTEAVVVKGESTAEKEETKALLLRKPVTWRERLKQCGITHLDRIVFGKSGIHGWGLFARKDMPQDSMVIEYCGDAVRPLIADLREMRYRNEGRDCYLFRVTDYCVVDSTTMGSISRFANHCCSPSLYSKVLELDGEAHVAFFARMDLKAGQELTYDYRFKVEEEDQKVRCQCGAPTCKGFLN